MKIIKLQLDYLQGPIWMSNVDTGKPLTGIDIVDNDEEIRKLNKKIADLFNDYYEFDFNGQPCQFNEEKERKEKYIMLSLLQQLTDRLNSINDGSYILEDNLTNYYKNL